MDILVKNFHANDAQISVINKYISMVISENQKMNLISKTTEFDIINRHVVDSLQILPHILSYINELDNGEKNISIADLGTGAGFPGIVLAIFTQKGVDGKNYKYNFDLIDKSPKKCNFLNKVVEVLDLQNVNILNINVDEDVIDKRYNIVTSRALAKLRELIPLSFKILKHDGTSIFLKGRSYMDEINDLKLDFPDISPVILNSITSDESRILLFKNVGDVKFKR